MGDLSSTPGLGRSPGEGIGYPLQYSWAFLVGSGGKESSCNARGLGSTSGLGRSPGEMQGNPLQYFCLKNPLSRGDLQAAVSGVTKSQTQLSD